MRLILSFLLAAVVGSFSIGCTKSDSIDDVGDGANEYEPGTMSSEANETEEKEEGAKSSD